MLMTPVSILRVCLKNLVLISIHPLKSRQPKVSWSMPSVPDAKRASIRPLTSAVNQRYFLVGKNKQKKHYLKVALNLIIR